MFSGGRGEGCVENEGARATEDYRLNICVAGDNRER